MSHGWTKRPAQLKRAWEENEALRLTVTTADGRLVPTTSVHVEDYVEELGDDGIEGIFVVPMDPLFFPEGNFFLDTRYWDGPGYWAEEDRASPHTPDP